MPLETSVDGVCIFRYVFPIRTGIVSVENSVDGLRCPDVRHSISAAEEASSKREPIGRTDCRDRVYNDVINKSL